MMQSKGEGDVKSEMPYRYFIEKAQTVTLRYGVHAPQIPGPEEYAHAWEVPDTLVVPLVSRALRQIYHFTDLGQDLALSCYKYFADMSPDLMIDWKANESRNIRFTLRADGIPYSIQERDVDDLRSFRAAIYESLVVTAMEMARLLYGGPYQGSYRYSRESMENLVRDARWDVFSYVRTGSTTRPNDTRTSHEPEEPKHPRMVVICVPPWHLAGPDLEDFAALRTVATGALDLIPGDVRTSKAHILWAIVYEACKEAHCSYFIITNYDYWVFGNMSRNYTIASVSSVFDFSKGSSVHQEPNLLQLLTYWELSSIGKTSWDIPLDEDIVNQGWY